jgi:hypothetical protein
MTMTRASRRRIRYVVIFANPFTGQLIEVHSPSVRLKYLFKDLESDMCPGALKLGFSNEQMSNWWESSGGSTKNARGFADLILVRVSQPSSDLSSIKVRARARAETRRLCLC